MATMDEDYFSQETRKQVLKLYGKNPFGTALIEFKDKEAKEEMVTTKTDPVSYIGDECLSTKVQEAFHPRLCDLATFVDSDIVWVTCHSNRSVVPKKMDGRMHIMSMMTPAWVDFTRRQIGSYTIDGKALVLPPGQKDYLDPIQDDIPGCDGIYDDYNHLMALMVGYNIYILTDCAHCSNEESLSVAIEVFEYIVNEAVKLWKECEKEN